MTLLSGYLADEPRTPAGRSRLSGAGTGRCLIRLFSVLYGRRDVEIQGTPLSQAGERRVLWRAPRVARTSATSDGSASRTTSGPNEKLTGPAAIRFSDTTSR